MRNVGSSLQTPFFDNDVWDRRAHAHSDRSRESGWVKKSND